LVARDRRELLLLGPALTADGLDPATLLGADPSAGLPRGADAATLRRLGSEIEMWLHEHPLNLERQRDAQLPVTALWLWGNAAASPAAATADAAARAPRGSSATTATRAAHESHAALPRLAGEDTYAQALWELGGAPVSAAPEPDAALTPDTALGAPRGAVLLQRVCEPPGVAPNLEQLERRWWAPVRAALRARRLSALYLLTGTQVHALSGWSLARFWRVKRPWWELL
jgi:hypothetical protein